MASTIMIEDFASPTHQWKLAGDSVMGGKSTGTVEIQDGLGVFDGQVVDVPFLQAPGFITMETRGGLYPDVSTCQGLLVELRAGHSYAGYRLSFGNVHAPGGRFAYGYKADFALEPSTEMGQIYLPFSHFTSKWDDSTGDAIVTCEEDSQYCPTTKSLENLANLIFWGEGVAGDVHLEIASIQAAHCGQQERESPDATALLPSSSKGPFGSTAVVVLALVGLLLYVVNRASLRRQRKNYSSVQGEESSDVEVIRC